VNFRGRSQLVLWAGIGLWLSALAGAARVRADAAAGPAGLIATYRADEGCPDRGQFERRVRARLAAGEQPATGRRFDVSLWRDARGARGRLELVGQDTGPARALAAASCEEAADALALVAALMLRDLGGAEIQSPTREGAAPRSSGHARPRARDDEARASEQREREQPTPPAERHVPAQEAAQPEAPPLAAREPDRTPAAAPARAFFSAPRLELALSGFAAFRVAPHVRPGLELALSLSARAAGGARLSAQLGLRASLPDRVRNEDGRARFSWYAAAPALCVAGPERRLWAFACALAELGALRARGRASDSGHAYARFWGALGPAAGAGLTLHPRVGLRLSGELLGVLVRDRFRLAGRPVFTVPSLAFRAELGVWITIW
jgi:hypothetical protein